MDLMVHVTGKFCPHCSSAIRRRHVMAFWKEGRMKRKHGIIIIIAYQSVTCKHPLDSLDHDDK